MEARLNICQLQDGALPVLPAHNPLPDPSPQSEVSASVTAVGTPARGSFSHPSWQRLGETHRPSGTGEADPEAQALGCIMR